MCVAGETVDKVVQWQGKLVEKKFVGIYESLSLSVKVFRSNILFYMNSHDRIVTKLSTKIKPLILIVRNA